MLNQIVNKQRRATSVIRTVLANAGMVNRSICIDVKHWSYQNECKEPQQNVSVFVSAPDGVDSTPYYQTGSTLIEAVRKLRIVIKEADETVTGSHIT